MPGARALPQDPPVTITVDGEKVVCAHTASAWWIGRLKDANWLGLACDAAPHLVARMWDREDAFDLDDAARLAIALTEHVTGMGWPRAVRLAAQAAHDWPMFEAWAATHAQGLDLMTAPPRRTLAAVNAMLLASCEKQADAERMMRQLDDPSGIPGITRAKRREAFTMSADEAAALSEPVPALNGGGGRGTR
jgi:hypothetical protein